MPKWDHENFGHVQKHAYLEGTILAVDAAEDLADVRLADSDIVGRDVPLYYHCTPDSEERANGALEGAAAAFSVDDAVIVRCEIKDGHTVAPVHVVGFVDGKKSCLHFYVLIRLFAQFRPKTGGTPAYGTGHWFVWDLETGALATDMYRYVGGGPDVERIEATDWPAPATDIQWALDNFSYGTNNAVWVKAGTSYYGYCNTYNPSNPCWGWEPSNECVKGGAAGSWSCNATETMQPSGPERRCIRACERTGTTSPMDMQRYSYGYADYTGVARLDGQTDVPAVAWLAYSVESELNGHYRLSGYDPTCHFDRYAASAKYRLQTPLDIDEGLFYDREYFYAKDYCPALYYHYNEINGLHLDMIMKGIMHKAGGRQPMVTVFLASQEVSERVYETGSGWSAIEYKSGYVVHAASEMFEDVMSEDPLDLERDPELEGVVGDMIEGMADKLGYGLDTHTIRLHDSNGLQLYYLV